MVLSTLLYAQKTSETVPVTKLLPQVIEGLNDRYAQRRCHSLQRLISDNRTLAELEKLVCVNNFFNQIPYTPDIKIWGKSDYWATPQETLIQGQADCEDYAIAKFYTLVHMGVPQEKLYLTYIDQGEGKVAHFVLTYYESEDAVPLVLDNRNLDIVPAVFSNRFKPVYRFNLNEFIAYHEGEEHRVPMTQMKFRKWQEFTQRMQSL
jgi:predicted transglutaminase-like cysteine proteinase